MEIMGFVWHQTGFQARNMDSIISHFSFSLYIGSTLHNTPFTEKKMFFFCTHKFVHYNFSLRCLILLQESATVYSDDENETKQQGNRKHEHETRLHTYTLQWIGVFFFFSLTVAAFRMLTLTVWVYRIGEWVSECVRVRLSYFGTVRVKIVLANVRFLTNTWAYFVRYQKTKKKRLGEQSMFWKCAQWFFVFRLL